MAIYVVCIDGTWNRPADPDGDPIKVGVETKLETNVHRMFRFLAGEGHGTPIGVTRVAPLKVDRRKPTPGEVLYLAGVGTSGNWATDRYDGATGKGTMERIRLAYEFLAGRFQPRDKIFGFGFSRGAFAVRSLAGLLHHVGLPSPSTKLTASRLQTIEERYRERLTTSPAVPGFQPAKVHFLGVWDTVESLHFEGDTAFHDVSPPNVRRVAHALALDEQRRDFAPTFWTRKPGRTKVEEVWFAGAHSNVGGGYENPHLSNIALAWMVAKAVEAKLPTEPAYIPQWYNENAHGLARDSHREFLRWLSLLGNYIKGGRERRAIHDTHKIHESVFDRIEGRESAYVTADGVPKTGDASYVPAARVRGIRPFPNKRTPFKERLAETPDYLGF